MQAHPGAIEARPGDVKALFGAMEAPPFRSEGSPPGAMEAHPLDMETPLEPLKGLSGEI